MHYFDYNATTPLGEVVAEERDRAEQEHWHNPSSPYRRAAAVQVRLAGARKELAELLSCEPEHIVFNSGATEANNALFAWLAETSSEKSTVAVSAIEHPCVLEAAHQWFPDRVQELAVDENGCLDLEALRSSLQSDSAPALVSVMAANNETGVIQPLEAAAGLCQQARVPFHTDAAQVFGKLSDLSAVNRAQYATGCAHKFGGPKGVGFLRLPAGGEGFQGQRGGEQERGQRGGTENYPGIRALVTALRIRQDARDWEAQNPLRNAFEARVKALVPGLKIIGEAAPRLPNTSLLIMPRHRNTRWVNRLERAGFELSTGAACATGKEGPSHVLQAHGIAPESMSRAVRVSSGWATRPEAWEALAEAFGAVKAELDQEHSTTAGGSTVISV